MFITCEQCNTTFRLDEKRLKPTGSKVRCSQCGNLFTAVPPAAPESTGWETSPASAVLPQSEPEPSAAEPKDDFDRKLEGIDLAELDSILEQQERSKEDTADAADMVGLDADACDELDEADLDMDFDAALQMDEEQVGDLQDEPPQRQEEDSFAEEELDLDMDFELDGAADEGQADQPLMESAAPEEGGLADDFEMVLDDFEDALEQKEEARDEASSTASGPADEIEPELELDLGPAEPDAEAGPVEPGEIPEDLDLDDLDSFLEEEISAAELETGELELSLDDGKGQSLDLEPDLALEEESDAGMTAQDNPGDEIDLAGLDELLDEQDGQEEQAADTDEIEFSLDEEESLELDLEEPSVLESAVAEDAAPADAAPEKNDDDLDLSDFDDLQDEDQKGEEPELSFGEEELELSLDEEPDLEMEKEIPQEPLTESGPEPEDEFDLSGLDNLLDEEPGMDKAEEDLELSLDEEPELDLASEDKGEASADDLEDLEFELDAEFEDKPVARGAVVQDEPAMLEPEAVEIEEEDDAELDLSDIEEMLEGDKLVPEKPATASAEDLELDLGEAPAADDDLGLGGDLDLDLTDIEAAIDAADTEVDQGLEIDDELDLDLEIEEDKVAPQEEELDLKLELESESAATQGGPAQEETDRDQIDLSDLDFSLEDENPSGETEVVDAGDMELEFHIEDTSEAITMSGAETMASITPASVTKEVPKPAPRPEPAAELEEDRALIQEAFAAQKPKEAKAAEKSAPVPRKKGAGKSLIVILILVILGGGGYFGYDYVKKNDIQIPYLSEYINPKPKDPSHIAQLSSLEINSKFIENEKAGRVFVVTGKVRNGYKAPCKMIRLQGKLFTKGKVLAKTEQTVAGIVIDDQELATQDVAGLTQRLKTPSAQDSAVVANPGQALPFMVVFTDLPADLDEFAVEMVSSTKTN